MSSTGGITEPPDTTVDLPGIVEQGLDKLAGPALEGAPGVWTRCYVCGKDPLYILQLDRGRWVCMACLYALVRDGRLVVMRKQDLEALELQPAEPSATVDEDGVVTLDGLTINFT